jgi:signal transduction histidine kinase
MVAPGEVIIEEGAPGDSLYIILSGELEVTKRTGGRDIALASRKAGEYLGEMSLLDNAPRSATVRAVAAGELLEVGSDAFHQLIRRMPSAVTSLLRTVAARLRSTESSLVQSDKLAALGTLAAGLAHELNNPAAAIQRSTQFLREAFSGWRVRSVALSHIDFSSEERAHLMALQDAIAQCGASRESDAATRREETRIEDRLEALGVAEPWELAPALAAYGWTVERVDAVAGDFAPEHLDPVLQWLGTGLGAQQLMDEIQRSGAAISELVGAVKSYAYLDQGPVQDVDLMKSLEDTLMILQHKLKSGVAVEKAFEPGLPRVEAFGGELNQVWTNIIDNAIQAMDGKGKLEIKARRVGEEAEIRIADSGPGIPPEVAPHIFEPFYTTKAQGVGTGLGLHIAHNIVVNRHRGRIDFETGPGRTEFRVVLPLRLGTAAPKTA